jgi:cyclomaltodextrinase
MGAVNQQPPNWAKGLVWYQIFPERFRNGDPGNDPDMASLAGAFPPEMPGSWQVHPWGSDWHKLQAWEDASIGLTERLSRRRYGGDLQGVIDKLDYLCDLGIGGIYLNPLFAAPSHHKYDATCYHHIDPHFGPDPQADRRAIASETLHDPATWNWTEADKLALKLIAEAHARDIRVIFDGVFNHLGWTSPAFTDVVTRQRNSPYASWFAVENWRDEKRQGEFRYRGWWNHPSLPELRQDKNGIDAGAAAYIYAATERWLRPQGVEYSEGIDGWRLDVASQIAHPFWQRWRQHVKSLNPEAVLIAELVLTPEEAKPFLYGDEFDGEMNYNLGMCLANWLFPEATKRLTTRQVCQQVSELNGTYAETVKHISMNLLGSHDTPRLLSLIRQGEKLDISNWGDFYNRSKPENTPAYGREKPDTNNKEQLQLFVFLQMTLPGAPTIYYGDEVGMWGANDPECRKPMLWEDIAYAPEALPLADGTLLQQPVGPDHSLYRFYRRLVRLRRHHIALRQGDLHFVEAPDEADVLCFARHSDTEQIIVICNRSDKTIETPIPQIWCRDTLRPIYGEQKPRHEGRHTVLSLEPYSGWIGINKGE